MNDEQQNDHKVEEDEHEENLTRSIDPFTQSSSVELSITSTGELPSIIENLTFLEQQQQQQKISSPILNDTVELTSPIVLDPPKEELNFEVIENGVVGDVNSNLREIVKEDKNHLNNSIKNETSLSLSNNINNNNCESLDVNLNSSKNKSLVNGNVSPKKTTEKSFTEDSEKVQRLASNNNCSNFEDFLPVQQSTELLHEEALSVSKDFDKSFEKIEDFEEQFVPGTAASESINFHFNNSLTLLIMGKDQVAFDQI